MPEDEIATAPLNNLDFIAHNADIYGEALAYLASQSDDSELLSVFSYDWRRDYAYAAARLQEFVCSNRATFEGHKIYVIAHSMGTGAQILAQELPQHGLHDRRAGRQLGVD